MKEAILGILSIVVVFALIILTGKANDEAKKGDKTLLYIVFIILDAFFLLYIYAFPDND
jgi:Mn2+/Fe2+ NRAMP family transporter